MGEQTPDHAKLPGDIVFTYIHDGTWDIKALLYAAADHAYKVGVKDGISQNSDETAAMYSEGEWYRKGKADAQAEAIEAAKGLMSAAVNAKGLLRDFRNETVPTQIEAGLVAWNEWEKKT